MEPQVLLALDSWLILAPFLWFVIMARRTFVTPGKFSPAILLGAVSLGSGIAMTAWAIQNVAHDPIAWDLGALLAVCSVVLYEAARRVVTGRGFYLALSGEVPPTVCIEGPYRYIRHPVYTSYLLAFLAVAVAYPAPETAGAFALNLLFFAYVAVDEERTIAHSALAEAYAAYRRRAGMFLPKLGRASVP